MYQKLDIKYSKVSMFPLYHRAIFKPKLFCRRVQTGPPPPLPSHYLKASRSGTVIFPSSNYQPLPLKSVNKSRSPITLAKFTKSQDYRTWYISSKTKSKGDKVNFCKIKVNQEINNEMIFFSFSICGLLISPFSRPNLPLWVHLNAEKFGQL